MKSEPEKDSNVPVIPALGQWRQEDCWDFKATLKCVSKTNKQKNQAWPGTRSYSMVECTL